MKHLPNLLTLGNLFCGTLALVFILQSPQFAAVYNGQTYIVTGPEPLAWGSALIGLAAVFDVLDGLAARLLKQVSPLGRELDSLADIVSFGIAPAMILYQFLRFSVMTTTMAMDASILWLIPALLLPCFAAVRLGRFNTDSSQTYAFRGLPTPAAGLVVASFPLIMLRDPYHFGEWLTNTWVLYGILALLCYLMVSRIPMLNLKFRNLGWKDNAGRYLLLLGTVAGILVAGYSAIPGIFVLYILLSLIFKPQAT